MKEDLFRKTSLDKVSSPEQLDELIRVANPRLWVILVAIIMLLVAVLGWSVFGALPTTLTAMGIAENGTVTFCLSATDTTKVISGMPIRSGEYKGEVASVSEVPLSRNEVSEVLRSDYLMQTMALSDWNTLITASIPNLPNGSCEIKVTVDSVQPIHFILN